MDLNPVKMEAIVSWARTTCLSRVSREYRSLLPCGLQLVTAAGEELKPLGVALVTVDIAGLLRRVEMRVVQRLQFDILLGYPTLKAFEASVDTLADKLRLGDGREVDVERVNLGTLIRPVRLISVGESPNLQLRCRAELPLPDRHLGLVFVPPEGWSLTSPEVVELLDGSRVFAISLPDPGIDMGLCSVSGHLGLWSWKLTG